MCSAGAQGWEPVSCGRIDVVLSKCACDQHAREGLSLLGWLRAQRDRRCAEHISLAPFCTENDHFTKTGSGQTWENSKKRCVFAGFRCVADSSVPIVQPCAECEGKPCVCVDGKGTPPEATGIVDLSGALNWVSSAVAKSVAVARKATPATSSAMTLSFVNATQSSSKSYCCSPLAIKWTDGAAPHASSIASANGVDVDRVGAGFSLTVAATNRLRKLTIYAGCWAAKCTLHAAMAPTAVAATDEVRGTPQPVVRQVTAGKAVLMYRWEIFVRSSEDAAATLSVTWLLEDGDGNVTFQAAMLEDVLA